MSLFEYLLGLPVAAISICLISILAAIDQGKKVTEWNNKMRVGMMTWGDLFFALFVMSFSWIVGLLFLILAAGLFSHWVFTLPIWDKKIKKGN